jgi:ketosteroid isomerase-like protein
VARERSTVAPSPGAVDAVGRNVEASREGFRLFEVADLDALVLLYSERAELWHPEGWPEPGPTTGRRAIKRQFATLREPWEEHKVVVEEIEGRDDWVVARVRWQARGGESGADVELGYSAATRFQGDGLIVEVHYCWDHADALAAAGWTQEAGKPPAG